MTQYWIGDHKHRRLIVMKNKIVDEGIAGNEK